MDANLKRSSRLFWRDMGPATHACHVYESGGELLETLTGYIGGGLWSGEAAIVVATNAHLDRLDNQLRETGLDLAHFRADDRYITISAEGLLPRFMVDDWPDEARFHEVLGEIVARARRGGRPVRVFGEMVAVLWSRRRYKAAIRLEHLWNDLILAGQFRLLCGYSRSDFGQADAPSIQAVHEAHELVATA